MRDDNQLSLLLLYKGGDGIDTLTNNRRALGGLIGFTSSTSLGAETEPLLLGLLAFRAVFVQKLEKLSGWKKIQNR